MIPKDQQTRDRGKRTLESFSAKQVELLHEIEQITDGHGHTIDSEDLEDHELALFAQMADLFEMNDNSDLLHPGHGMPVVDIRTAHPPDSLPDPPNGAGRDDPIEQQLLS